MAGDESDFVFEIYSAEPEEQAGVELEELGIRAGPAAVFRRLVPSSKTPQELSAQWQPALGHLQGLLGEVAAEQPKGFSMDQVEVSLQVSAKGGLAFIAEAGVQGNVKVIFKRSK